MPTIFQEKKARIIQQLDVPEGEYNDLSPKGSVDIGIRELLAEINAIATLVTTSSCAGRVCVYVEGQKQPAKSFRGQSADAVASSGGKGGGKWLFVSHDPVNTHSSLCGLFGLKDASAVSSTGLTASARLIHFKFEAMILHVLAASLEDAGKLLTAGSTAGFRESGAMGLSPNRDGSVTPMVAIRSNGLALDSVIGYVDAHEEATCIVSEDHLRLLNNIANERFKINTQRIERFRQAILSFYAPSCASDAQSSDSGYENAATRKARKRAEGLAKQEALRAQKVITSNEAAIPELNFPE